MMNTDDVSSRQSSAPGSSSNSLSTSTASVKEYSIRVPKNSKKKYHVMRFNSNLNIDFAKWKKIEMERENNKVERPVAEEMPKFGAGSEYRREEKEEARKKRFGYTSRNYNPDDQPWILKCEEKDGSNKKFKGIREGGVGENASYYIFTHGSDGTIEAYPAVEWYNFQPIQRFKALSAEEAELEFGKRNKSLNYFSLMMRKRFHKDEEDELEEESGSNKKHLKISDMDDWIDSDEDEDDNDDENGDNDSENERQKNKKKEVAKKKTAAEKKKKVNSDESAFEESDDGDEEGRELDYISDSSENVTDDEGKIDKEMRGVSFTSDEEEDEDEEKKKSDQEEKPQNEEASPPPSDVKKKKKKEPSTPKTASGVAAAKNEDTSSDFSAYSSDSDSEKVKSEIKFDPSQPSTSASSSGVSESADRKSRSRESCVTEEAVRRYLTRWPMTAAELLHKFKKRNTNLSSQKLAEDLTQVLKKINPKITGQNKMHLEKPEKLSKSKT